VILFKSAVTDDADDTGTKRPQTPPSCFQRNSPYRGPHALCAIRPEMLSRLSQRSVHTLKCC